MTFPTLIASLGAASIGFVLGWTLYFANRGKSGNLTVADIAAIAGVLAGSTIVAFLDGFGIPDMERAFVFGGYGIGVLIGFLTYFQLYRASLREGANPENGEALKSLQEARAFSAVPFLPKRTLLRANQVVSGSLTPQGDLSEAIAAAEAASTDLAIRIENATDPNHKDYDPVGYLKFVRLQQHVTQIEEHLYTLSALAGLNSSELSALLGALNQEATNLNNEADRLKEATADITQLADTFDLLNTLTEKLRAL